MWGGRTQDGRVSRVARVTKGSDAEASNNARTSPPLLRVLRVPRAPPGGAAMRLPMAKYVSFSRHGRNSGIYMHPGARGAPSEGGRG